MVIRAMLASGTVLLAFAAACHAPPIADPGHGAGLVSFDREPPAGAEVFARPQWKAGDRFAWRKGKLRRMACRVEPDEGGGWRLLQEDTGSYLRLDANLRELGEQRAGKDGARVDLDPGDDRYAWPLWAGKRWACQFVRREPGQPAFPLVASYRCDAIEDVTVPAGTFRCLRIWRTTRVAAQGEYVERVALVWYSPEAGTAVRSLDDGIVTELEELHRQ